MTVFGKIVASFVTDIIMPPIGLLLGGVDFSDLTITLKEAVGETAAVTINYGVFLGLVVDFVIVAFVIFMIVKQMNRFKKEKVKEEKGPTEIELLEEIRDALKK